jgi:hypothetical protein
MTLSRTILIAILGVTALVGGYILFHEEPIITLNAQEEGEVEELTATAIIGEDLMQAIETVKSINLDKSLFSDDAFVSLVNYETPIDPQPIGRDNPFAPVPGLPKPAN